MGLIMWSVPFNFLLGTFSEAQKGKENRTGNSQTPSPGFNNLLSFFFLNYFEVYYRHHDISSLNSSTFVSLNKRKCFCLISKGRVILSTLSLRDEGADR